MTRHHIVGLKGLIAFSKLLEANDPSIAQIDKFTWNAWSPSGLDFDDSILGIPRECYERLWRILSHRNAKFTHIGFSEQNPGAGVASRAVELVKRWCTEIHSNVPRRLTIILVGSHTDRNSKILNHLREGLTTPGNRVVDLSITCARCLSLGTLLVQPLLEHPSNELSRLVFTDETSESPSRSKVTEKEARAISRGLRSPNCKLKELEFDSPCLGFREANTLLEGILGMRCLERLSLGQGACWVGEVTDEQRLALISQLAELLARPSNHLRHLTWKFRDVTQGEATLLANAMGSEHFQLEELDCGWSLLGKDAAKPLFYALRSPNNRLKSLRGRFSGREAFDVLGESLKHPSCKLETLQTQSHSYVNGFYHEDDWSDLCNAREGLAIVEGLTGASPSRVARLHVGYQPPVVFRAFTEFLRSSRSKLVELEMTHTSNMNEALLRDYYRAVRSSGVVKVMGGGRDLDQFRRAFEKPFLSVMYALLSAKVIPRLGELAWVTLLPMQDLILEIANTLCWPLDDLRV